MTVLIWGLDGLDIRYVREHGLLSSLDPTELYNDLEGANALNTYRVWPAIWRGVNGGKDEDDPSARYDQPDDRFVWDKYAAHVMLAPTADGLYSQYQDQFPEDFRESLGPQGRLDDVQKKFRNGILEAADAGAQVIIAVSRMPDIVGHMENNEDRAHQKIRDACRLAEETINYQEIDHHLLVSDHGFQYEEIGNEPDGYDAHSRHGTITSDFANYGDMSDFIENWHDDLHEAVINEQIRDLGYK